MRIHKTLGWYPLPSYLSIEVVDFGDSRHVVVTSTIHKPNVKQLPHSFGMTFTDGQILSDASTINAITKAYNLKLSPQVWE